MKIFKPAHMSTLSAWDFLPLHSNSHGKVTLPTLINVDTRLGVFIYTFLFFLFRSNAHLTLICLTFLWTQFLTIIQLSFYCVCFSDNVFSTWVDNIDHHAKIKKKIDKCHQAKVMSSPYCETTQTKGTRLNYLKPNLNIRVGGNENKTTNFRNKVF